MTVSEVIAPPQRGAPVWGLWTPLALVITALALAPAVGLPHFAQSLVIEALIFSILALSLDILLGYTGLVSFGHAAFFGVAGYAMAIAATRLTPDLGTTVPIGVAAAVALAIPLGWLSIRLSGFYFLMITFAFAQMIYVAAFVGSG